MKILAEKKTSTNNYVLVKYTDNDNSYAHGLEQDLNDKCGGFPIDNRGTKEEVINHCKMIAQLDKDHIEEFKRQRQMNTNPKTDRGWALLIENAQNEINALNYFVEVLSTM